MEKVFALVAGLFLFAAVGHAQDDFFTGINLRSGSALKLYDAGTHSVAVTAPTLAADLTLKLPATAGADGQVLTTNGSGQTSWATPSASRCQRATWPAADGATKTFVHGFGTEDVWITVYDIGTRETLHVAEVRDDANTVILTASEAPSAAGWRAVICAP